MEVVIFLFEPWIHLYYITKNIIMIINYNNDYGDGGSCGCSGGSNDDNYNCQNETTIGKQKSGDKSLVNLT
jgi:hypothetical protein